VELKANPCAWGYQTVSFLPLVTEQLGGTWATQRWRCLTGLPAGDRLPHEIAAAIWVPRMVYFGTGRKLFESTFPPRMLPDILR